MKTKEKHVNIPVFIPHLGCPNQCVFCNQRTISGTSSFSEDDAAGIIEENLTTLRGTGKKCEIAFFGGSFTGIDRGLMIRMLDLAESYVKSGDVSGIRMSTRPDYISDEITEILSQYTVSQVELGIQSMSDSVLSACKRGHTAADTEKACALLNKAGFSFVGQMMIGLPTATAADEAECARRICEMGADGARVYPTVVFRATELAANAENGTYKPLTVDEAVERSANVLKIFDKYGVDVIRVGLCDNESLHSDETYVAGPNHSAIGEMARSAVFFDKMCALLDSAIAENKPVAGKRLTFTVPKGAASMAAGHKRKNTESIINIYNAKCVKILENPSLMRYNIRVDIM